MHNVGETLLCIRGIPGYVFNEVPVGSETTCTDYAPSLSAEQLVPLVVALYIVYIFIAGGYLCCSELVPEPCSACFMFSVLHKRVWHASASHERTN